MKYSGDTSDEIIKTRAQQSRDRGDLEWITMHLSHLAMWMSKFARQVKHESVLRTSVHRENDDFCNQDTADLMQVFCQVS